jgi:GT2 family glycosyltransferase
VNDAAIIIADNKSSDDSIDYLKTNFPEIRIIENSENGGFAKGYNDAFAQVDAEYYILLNSDIEVTENWIKPVIDLMDSNPNIAVCQPKIRSYNERSKFEYAGAAGGFIDKYGYPFCRGRLFQTVEEDKGQYDDGADIFWATGACMFVRATVYHKYGGLDNDFFAHMEEIDFCWRLKNHGFRIVYCPASTVYHVGGGTLPKSSSRKTYLNFRNNFTLLYKNLPASRLFVVFLVRLPLDGIASVKFLYDGGFKDFFAVARAHFSFYLSLPKNHRKRKLIKPKKVSEMYRRNVVIDYFLKKKRTFTDLSQNSFS